MPNAIISVSDKKSLDILVPYLENKKFAIYSTGSTYKQISCFIKNSQNLHLVSEYTDSPEICDGRVKTLHPRIFGGILGDRANPEHLSDIINNKGVFFDLVVVNLYPFIEKFEETSNEEELLENIDIGGHTLIRASMKNYKDVAILTSPNQYIDYVSEDISNKDLACAAAKHILEYDICINFWLNGEFCNIYREFKELKYGLNPYMKPSTIMTKNDVEPYFEIINGNPSYINMLDCENAIKLVIEAKNALKENFCCSFKHTSPAGVGKTFQEARNVDPKSSFGDIIGYSGIIDTEIALKIKSVISDGIIACDYTLGALEILKRKKKDNYIILKQDKLNTKPQFRDINGVTLVQPINDSLYVCNDDSIPLNIRNDMTLGYITLKYTQSNSVCFVYEGKVIGIGAGQQNRVDCIKIAGDKANEWFERNSIIDRSCLLLVSDAFFPFKDNIETASMYNTSYILQPGGSIRDDEIFTRAQELNIKMILSHMRIFTH